MRQPETDIRRAKNFVNETWAREYFHGPLRQLEDEYRGHRGRNRQKPLRESRDEIDLVCHVLSPFIESIER
jgi:hypothetical protein